MSKFIPSCLNLKQFAPFIRELPMMIVQRLDLPAIFGGRTVPVDTAKREQMPWRVQDQARAQAHL
jgi:hypothetical protein